MGITNTFATIPGFVAPQLTDSMTTADPKTRECRASCLSRSLDHVHFGQTRIE